MRPIGKYIVLDPIKEETTTDSGLLLSGEDTDKLRYGRGVVVASGTDVEVISSGEELYYDKRASYTMLIDGIARTIISERDVVNQHGVARPLVVVWFLARGDDLNVGTRCHNNTTTVAQLVGVFTAQKQTAVSSGLLLDWV
jgi:co-chaperonin GroES (HSP10)